MVRLQPGHAEAVPPLARRQRALRRRASAACPTCRRTAACPPLSLAEVNRLAHRQWPSWDDVDPPRTFPGDGTTRGGAGRASRSGTTRGIANGTAFAGTSSPCTTTNSRRWVHAMGIPRERIFSAQAFIAPDRRQTAGGAPHPRAEPRLRFRRRVDRGRDSARQATWERSCTDQRPRTGTRWRTAAACSRRSRGWIPGGASSSTTPPISSEPAVLPTYAADLSHAARSLQLRRQPDRDDGVERLQRAATRGSRATSPYTAWRNTPGEDALRRLPGRPRRPAARRAAVDLRDAAARGRRRLVARPGATRRRPGLCRSRARRRRPC